MRFVTSKTLLSKTPCIRNFLKEKMKFLILTAEQVFAPVSNITCNKSCSNLSALVFES